MTSSNLARVTLAASIDAAKSGRPLAAAMRIASKSVAAEEAEAPCRECGGVEEHLDACPTLEVDSPHFYSEKSLGGRPW